MTEITDEELEAAFDAYTEAYELALVRYTGRGSEGQSPTTLLARGIAGGLTDYQRGQAMRKDALRAALLAFLRKRDVA